MLVSGFQKSDSVIHGAGIFEQSHSGSSVTQSFLRTCRVPVPCLSPTDTADPGTVPASWNSKLTGESLGNTWGMVSGARPVGSQLQLCHALGELPEDAPSFLRTFSDVSGFGQSFLLIQVEQSFAFGECCVKGENIKQMKRELVGKGREAL